MKLSYRRTADTCVGTVFHADRQLTVKVKFNKNKNNEKPLHQKQIRVVQKPREFIVDFRRGKFPSDSGVGGNKWIPGKGLSSTYLEKF